MLESSRINRYKERYEQIMNGSIKELNIDIWNYLLKLVEDNNGFLPLKSHVEFDNTKNLYATSIKLEKNKLLLNCRIVTPEGDDWGTTNAILSYNCETNLLIEIAENCYDFSVNKLNYISINCLIDGEDSSETKLCLVVDEDEDCSQHQDIFHRFNPNEEILGEQDGFHVYSFSLVLV